MQSSLRLTAIFDILNSGLSPTYSDLFAHVVLIMLVISLWLNRITGALWLVKHILYISPKPQSYLQQFLSVNGRNNLPNTTYFLTFLSITRYVRRKNCTLLETKLNWVFNFKLHSR